MGQVARLGDASSHGGVIVTGASCTLVNGMPVAREGDMHSCPLPGHGVTPIVSGSPTTSVEGSPVARVGDTVGCGAVIVSGSPDTVID